MMRVTACYDVRHGGDVLAKVQEDAKTSLWFWYGMKGVSGNTVSNPRQFNVVKAEVISACRAHLAASPVTSTTREGIADPHEHSPPCGGLDDCPYPDCLVNGHCASVTSTDRGGK